MKQYIFNFTDNSEGIEPSKKYRFIQLSATNIWDAIAKYRTIYPEAEAENDRYNINSISEAA